MEVIDHLDGHHRVRDEGQHSARSSARLARKGVSSTRLAHKDVQIESPFYDLGPALALRQEGGILAGPDPRESGSFASQVHCSLSSHVRFHRCGFACNVFTLSSSSVLSWIETLDVAQALSSPPIPDAHYAEVS